MVVDENLNKDVVVGEDGDKSGENENLKVSINDLNDWVRNEVKGDLFELGSDVEKSSYVKDYNEETLTLKKESVIQYLESIADKTPEELKEGNTSSWIMAVQSALTYLGYKPGIIDGIFKSQTQKLSNVESNTMKAVKKFQEQYELTENDGFPGSETIKKLLELLKGDDSKEKGTEAEDKSGKPVIENLEKNEENEKQEKEWLEKLKFKDLGSWNGKGDGVFTFLDGIVDSENGRLTIDGKTIEKVEDGGEGFGYMLEDEALSIGNFKNGVLNGIGIRFVPYLQKYFSEDYFGIKYQGEWVDGELNNGVQIVKEDGLDVYIDKKEGKATKCYLDHESISFDLECCEDGLYAVNKRGINRDNRLKLDNELSAPQIMRILYSCNNKQGSFSYGGEDVDANMNFNGYLRAKSLIREDTSGKETKRILIDNHVDDIVDSQLGVEAMELANWLNGYLNTHKEFEINEYGEFNVSTGKFDIKEDLRKDDNDGNGTYIEFNGEKYYEYKEGMSRLGYQTDKNSEGKVWFYIGDFVDGMANGKGCFIVSDGQEYKGDWKDNKRYGRGTCTYADGEKYEGYYEDDKKHGRGTSTYANGDKYEGEHVNGKREKQGTYTWKNGNEYKGEFKDGKCHGIGTFTLKNGDKYECEWDNDCMGNGKVTLVEPNELKGEYPLERDEKGLKIVVGGVDKYLDIDQGKTTN